MSFNSDIRQFTTPAAFAAYLSTLPKPAWKPKGSTYHNTYRPTEAMWRGRASMLSMQAGYEAKGWTAGPHVYLALGSPNPAHNGIWTMTPPTMPGVHGVTCNVTHFGIEVVGDFQSKQPSAAQQQLLLDVVTALHRWAGIGPVLNAHRDCVERTCPGDAFYALKPSLVARLIAQMTPPPKPAPVLYRAIAPMWISERPDPRGPVALGGRPEAFVYQNDTVVIDEVRADGYAHSQDGVGFLPIGGLERLPVTLREEPSS